MYARSRIWLYDHEQERKEKGDTESRRFILRLRRNIGLYGKSADWFIQQVLKAIALLNSSFNKACHGVRDEVLVHSDPALMAFRVADLPYSLMDGQSPRARDSVTLGAP